MSAFRFVVLGMPEACTLIISFQFPNHVCTCCSADLRAGVHQHAASGELPLQEVEEVEVAPGSSRRALCPVEVDQGRSAACAQLACSEVGSLSFRLGWHIDSLVPMEESLSLWFNGAADSMEPPTKGLHKACINPKHHVAIFYLGSGWKFWCKGKYKKSCISFEDTVVLYD